MQLGLCTISNMELPVERVLQVAADIGYEGIEVWGKDHLGDGDADACASIRQTAGELGLDVAVYGSYLTVGTDGFADAHERELTIADRLGADLIRVWPGDCEYGDHTPSEFESAVTDLRTLAERAAERGLGVTIEKHEGRLSNTTEGARRLVDAVDHPDCGLNWQPLFVLSERELLAEAETLAPRSNNVHLQAPAERDGDERTLLSNAYVDVGAVLERFERAGYDGYVEVEFVSQDRPYEDAVRRDHEYLRSLVENADHD